MPVPDPARFAALARSSPWRWRTLRFTVRWSGWPYGRQRPLRAWLRRPDGLRVETLDAQLVQADREAHPWGWSEELVDGEWQRQPDPYGPLDPRAPTPGYDDEGLVARRPEEWEGLRYDDPMYQDYRWVAMLDPVELADGVGRSVGAAQTAPVVFTTVVEVVHRSRVAWEAILRPTADYAPRCSCCPLLFSAESEAQLAERSRRTLQKRDPALRYADAHRVRLDVATGICVFTEELGGTHPGSGHDVGIESVDDELSDSLFIPR